MCDVIFFTESSETDSASIKSKAQETEIGNINEQLNYF